MKLLNADFKKVMKAYQAVRTVCKSDTKISLFEGVAVIAPEDNTLRITVDVDSAEHKEDVHLDSETCEVLRKLKSKDDLEFVDKLLKIGQRNIHIEQSHEPMKLDINFPDSQVYSATEVDFKKALKAVNEARGSSKDTPVFGDVLIDGQVLMALDGFRVYTRRIDAVEDAYIKMNPQTVDLLLKLLTDKKSVDMVNIYQCFATTDLTISFGDYTIYTKESDNEAFKYKELMQRDNATLIGIDREILKESLEFYISTKKINNGMFITLNGEYAVIGDDGLPCEYEDFDKELKILVNPKFLLDSIKHSTSKNIKLGFASKLEPIMVYQKNGIDLILPMRS